MAPKKTTRSRGKTSRKTKTRRKSPEFPPNPRKPFTLRKIVDRMEDDPAFAQFIKDLLCATNSSDSTEAEAARNCLSSYYRPTDDELVALCLPKKDIKSLQRCTVVTHNLLIIVPADRLRDRR